MQPDDRDQSERTPGDVESESALPTQARLQARLQRLEVLRGAARAITPSIPGQPGTPPFAGVELGETLGGLVERLVSAEAEGADPKHALNEKRSIARELVRVDAELMVRGAEIRELTDEIPLVQLRASLPSVAHRRRFDVVSLLDLLIQDQSRIFERLVPFDYLITMLATEERDGKRWVANDPVSLTRLRFLCERAQSMHADEGAVVEQEFFAAALPFGSHGDLNGLIARMRRRKNGLGYLIFVPGVLRAVVTYNAAITNLIEDELTQAKCESDAEILGWQTFAEREQEDRGEVVESSDWAGSADADAANACSVFESPAMDAIAQALRRRCEGSSLGATAVERVVLRMDLRELDDSARAHLLRMDESHADRIVGLAVAAGLVSRTGLESSLDLRELGIAPERLQEDWVPELDWALNDVVNEMAAEDASEEARGLAAIKSRFLSESIRPTSRPPSQAETIGGDVSPAGEVATEEVARAGIAGGAALAKRMANAITGRVGALRSAVRGLRDRLARR